MQKVDLFNVVNKLREDEKVSKKKLMGWVNALKSDNTNKPTKFKVGDVFMSRAFQHPYVLLEQNSDGHWLCGLLTSKETCRNVLEPCNSRFFVDNYFTKVLFIETKVEGRFMGIFDNRRQINRVLKKSKQLICGF
jgi:hypothetical protein